MKRSSIPGIVWRTLWRSVAALLIFAQVAAAAEQCSPKRLAGERHVLAGAAAHGHHDLDAYCVGDLVPADAAPASEAKRVVPDMGMSVPTAWDVTLDAGALPVSYALARAGPSFRLQFQNLRL